MAIWTLYVDMAGGGLVAGIDSPEAANPPPLVQGDSPTWRIYLLRRTSTFPLLKPFTYQDTSGSLQVAIGKRVGDSETLYTWQYTWTPSGKAEDPYWEAELALDTAGITTLLSTASQQSAWLEVKHLPASGKPTTVLDLQVTVNASVIKTAGVPTTPPGLSPASVEFCRATFLAREVDGAIIFKNLNTGKRMALYLGDDDELHRDALT